MVDYELQGRVAVLTLNRPEARNAVNGDVANGMEAAIDRLEEDDAAWVGELAAWCAAHGVAKVSELTGTLKNIKDTGAITLGFRDSSIPFSYLDDNQKPVGFAMDICYKIVDAVKKELKLDKLEVKLNPVTSATRIPLMANGTIDLECGSTTNNAERQKQVWFTNTHFLTASRYVFKKSSNLKSIDDLKGKTVVSTAGTTNIKQLTEANVAKNLGANIIPAKDHAEAFLMVETDRAVAFVMDDILLASLVAVSLFHRARATRAAARTRPHRRHARQPCGGRRFGRSQRLGSVVDLIVKHVEPDGE